MMRMLLWSVSLLTFWTLPVASIWMSSDSQGQVNFAITICSGDKLPKLCPKNCTCCLFTPGESLQLNVNCSDNISTNFDAQVDIILQHWPNITHLEIQHTPLSNFSIVDLSILKYLSYLNLDFNQLSSLDDANLSCLTSLTFLSASNNKLGKISDETFRGLLSLQTIILNHNEIGHVSTNAFTSLPALTVVSLGGNQLTSLDIWPLYLTVTLPQETSFDFESNQLTEFTNNLNWTYNCGMHGANGEIGMKINNITHLTPILHGWSLYKPIQILCLFTKDKFRCDFRRNRLNCDCIDFDIYKFLRAVKKSKLISELFCSAPPNLYDDQITKLPSTDFVCHVKENCSATCDCVESPGDQTYYIKCQNKKLILPPPTVPLVLKGSYVYKFKYKLEFQNNTMESVPHRSYYSLAYSVDFSNNKIESINVTILHDLQEVQFMYLHDNKLASMPKDVINMNFTNLETLSLHGNPWSCDCEYQWVKSWLTKIVHKLQSKDAILCYSPERLRGQNILKVADKDFCTDPAKEQMRKIIIISVTSVAAVILLVIAPFATLYVHRKWVYTKVKWHPFDLDECNGENKRYDVFISYANEDKEWVFNLIHALEENGFGTFHHRRDFIGGRPILQNVGEAVENSKRTLCILSPNFVDSEISMWEFTTALNIDIMEKKHRLIVVYRETIPEEVMNMNVMLRDYIRNFTYIDPESPHFFQNLLYSLPVERIGTAPEDMVHRPPQHDQLQNAEAGPQGAMPADGQLPFPIGGQDGDINEIDHTDLEPLMLPAQ